MLKCSILALVMCAAGFILVHGPPVDAREGDWRGGSPDDFEGGDDANFGRSDGIRAWDGQILWDDDVVILNGRNMHSFVRKHPHVLVQFFAPWCGHCKKFDPIYRKAASHLRREGSTALLAKVDGPANPNLSQSVGVAGFPSLHWFAYGDERSYDGGRRNDSLVEWVTHHARHDAVTIVGSTREADDYLIRIGAEESVIGRFPSRHSREARAFMLAAEEDTVGRPSKMMVYVMITDAQGIGLEKIGSVAGQQRSSDEVFGPPIGPSMVIRRPPTAGGGTVVFARWYTPPLWHTTAPDIRFLLFHVDRIKAFIGTYRMPSVVSLSPSTWGKVLASPNRNQTILFSDPSDPGHASRMAAFDTVAKDMFGRVLFLQIPSNMSNVLKYFGMSPEDYPAVVVAVAPTGEHDNGQMHRLDQSLVGNNLTLIAQEDRGGATRGDGCIEETCSQQPSNEAVAKLSKIIRTFAVSAFGGKVDEFVLPKQDLSDDIHYPDDPVVKLTPSELAKVAQDEERDVVVKFFAPWCGHCKAMKVAYMELFDKMELHTGVSVTEYDASTNKVPPELQDLVQGYPTILLFPAGPPSRPIVYTGARELEAMAQWVQQHAVTIQRRDGLRKRIEELEGAMKGFVREERFEDAAKVRDELAVLRKEMAGSEVLVPGAGTPKHRLPTFGPKILKATMQELQKKGAEGGQKAVGGAEEARDRGEL